MYANIQKKSRMSCSGSAQTTRKLSKKGIKTAICQYSGHRLIVLPLWVFCFETKIASGKNKTK